MNDMDKKTPRLGRSGPRSRNGCWTCRAKKVKCDETWPTCLRCTRLDLVCDYEPRRKVIGNRGWGTARCAQPYGSMGTNATLPALADDSRAILDMEAAGPGDGDAEVDARLHWMGSSGTTLPPRKTAQFQVTLDVPLFQLPTPNVGASSVELTIDDHEAIREYRTSFSKLYHTKNPRYSLFSVMLTVAERSRIAMHMILALAGSEIDRKQGSQSRNGEEEDQSSRRISKRKSRALHHYSVALRLMANVVGQDHGAETCGDVVDLDCILTALYLMLLYEQMFGSRQGLSNHLAGAAIIVQHHCAHLVQLKLRGTERLGDGGTQQSGQQLAFSQTARPGSEPQISQYTARLVARLALSDAAATSYGIGGEVIEALYNVLGLHIGGSPSLNPMDTLNSLDGYAVTLYRNVWGESYPPAELADDVENRPVFAFYGAVLQLRFMISQLSKTLLDPGGDAVANTKSLASVHATIQATGLRFADVLATSAGLSLASDGSHRLVTNLRFVVPHYHAVVLEFQRLTAVRRPGLASNEAQRVALQGIMNLAVQAFRHEGDEAMLRIAQPLFMVALETDDVLHREWVLERFEGLSCFGGRFERARMFLLKTIQRQQTLGRKVDVQEQFRLDDRNPTIFVF